MLMAFFAVVGYYIFGYEEETGDKENWGTLSTAMLTLFTFVTVSCVHVFFVLFCFVLFFSFQTVVSKNEMNLAS